MIVPTLVKAAIVTTVSSSASISILPADVLPSVIAVALSASISNSAKYLVAPRITDVALSANTLVT